MFRAAEVTPLLVWLLLLAMPFDAWAACPVQIVSPAPDSRVSGPVRIVVEPRSNTVEWVNLWADDDYVASSPPYTFKWDSTGYSSGTHRIQAAAFGENRTFLCSAMVSVEVSNPPVTVILPSTGTIVSGTVNVTTKVTQEVDWINLSVDGEYSESPDYNFGFDTTKYADGWHTLSIDAMQDPDTFLGHATIAINVSNQTPARTLVAGGYAGASIFNSTEIYDPETRLFTASAPMQTTRSSHTATRLLNGQVLMAGGYFSSQDAVTSSAELFDPASAEFGASGSMTEARTGHVAALLASGRVLVAGGRDVNLQILGSAELFDPVSGGFTPTGKLNSARVAHVATLLPNQTVLVAGGISDQSVSLVSAELYDPSLGIFIATGDMAHSRIGHTLTVLGNNKVLVVGGAGTAAELFDPGLGEFAPTGTMTVARVGQTATLLLNGKVLIVGGTDGNNQATATAELYDPDSGVFAPTGSLAAARVRHTATLLSDGTVLIEGGGSKVAEIYDPNSEIFVPGGDETNMPTGGQTATLIR
jgi:hypothetical protein